MEEKETKKNNKKEAIRALKFAIVSASAGLVEIGVFALMNEVICPDKYWPCYLTALIASVLWCFTINRRYTFKSAKNVPKAMAMVFAFYLFFTPASTWIGNYLAETAHWNGYLVTGLNMVCNLLLEYLWDTFVVYRNDMDNNAVAERQAAREAARAAAEENEE